MKMPRFSVVSAASLVAAATALPVRAQGVLGDLPIIGTPQAGESRFSPPRRPSRPTFTGSMDFSS